MAYPPPSRSLIAATLVLLAALVSATARANQNVGSAGYMLPLCRDWLKVAVDRDIEAIKYMLRSDPSRLTVVGMCAGFVVGISETLRTIEVSCPPDGVTNEQLVRMVVKEIEQHPERMHQDFSAPAIATMIVAWPCRK